MAFPVIYDAPVSDKPIMTTEEYYIGLRRTPKNRPQRNRRFALHPAIPRSGNTVIANCDNHDPPIIIDEPIQTLETPGMDVLMNDPEKITTYPVTTPAAARDMDGDNTDHSNRERSDTREGPAVQEMARTVMPVT